MIEYNSAMMIHATQFFLFLTAAVLLAIAPGPGMLYVLARTLAGGKREGILSALGTFLGGMAHVFAAAAGISVILAKSASAFATVKYAGAAYLCYLGIRMILDAQKQEAALSNKEFLPQGTFPRRSAFWQGVITEVLNPKTALFFLSFIPQFVNPHLGRVLLQFLVLGFMSVTLNTLADLGVVSFAAPIGVRLKSSRQFRRNQRVLSGAAMIGLGTFVAFGDSK